MKTHAILVSVALAIASCSSTESNQSNQQDSVATNTASTNPVSENVVFEGIDAESLTTELLKQDPMAGEFLRSEAVSDKVLDVSDLDTDRELIAIWIQSGEGEYTGVRESEYETIHSRLAVFEIVDTLTRLVDMRDFESSSRGLLLYSESVETYDLTSKRQGLVVHHESSESGAGDGGFEKDEIEVFALKDGKLFSIFTVSLLDNQFVSDEMGSYYERNSKGELTVLESKTNGLFDISVNTLTTENSVEAEEESEGEEASETETDESATDTEEVVATDEPAEETQETETTPPLVIYSWNGEQYVPADSD